MMKYKTIFILLLMAILVMPFEGCMRFAVRMTPSLFPQLTTSFFEECDPELAKNSIPASLKILEGLLKSDPGNRVILKALCTGFCGYSMLFVEEDSPERASNLYLRARDYGLTALGLNPKISSDLNSEAVLSMLNSIGDDDIETLLWTTVSWNAWINLNIDKPSALGQFRLSQLCLKKILSIDAYSQYGLPLILMGASLSALPPMLGGDPDKAKEYFQDAMDFSQGKYFLAQYYFARYYAVRVQDRDLFSALIDGIIQGDPTELKEACLINSVIQEKARRLNEKIDELFL
jgi:tetratricopeptide (TPR) repeat protein